MRTLVLVAAALLVTVSARAADDAGPTKDQPKDTAPQRSIKGESATNIVAGGGLVFGTEPDTLGIQGNVYVPIPQLKGLRVGGDIVMYLPWHDGDEHLFWFSLNPGAQFVFDIGAPIHPYAEAGIAIVFVHAGFPNGGSDSTTEVGLNLGGGAEYDLSFARVYGGLRFQFLGDSLDQAEFSGGLRWSL